MPVRFNTYPSLPNVFGDSDQNYVEIGLVNNMSDSALQATERQFLALLEAASNGMMVCLTPYALPEVPRSDSGRSHVSSYFSVNDLWDKSLDGLIVTGMEPCAVNLAEEPYWPSFTRLVDWAEESTASSIWSCLAAHAASAAHRRYPSIQVRGKAFRHFRLRPRLGSRIDIQRFGTFPNAALEVERLAGRGSYRLRLSPPHAFRSRCGFFC